MGKVTKKYIMSNYQVISLPRMAENDFTRNWLSPDCFTVGIYGWNANVYLVSETIAVVVGDRPFGHVKMSQKEWDASKAAILADLCHYRSLDNKELIL